MIDYLLKKRLVFQGGGATAPLSPKYMYGPEHLLGVNLRRIMASHQEGVKDSHPLNTTENIDKRRLD